MVQYDGCICGGEALTVSARLHRCLDVSDALDGHTVLVIAVDELVLKLANLVN